MSTGLKFVLIVLCLSALAQAEDVEVNCDFTTSGGRYSCTLSGITIPDEETNVIIGGNHLPGQDDADVERVYVMMSNVPFIMSEIFTRFPNVHDFILGDSGLTRIQPYAFQNAENLRFLSINANNLPYIHNNAFTGAYSLETLDLNGNGIELIHETAFEGLVSLTHLFLDFNQLRELHADVFRPLISIVSLYFNSNLLEVLPGNLLADHPDLTRIEFTRNYVNAIGREFLEGIPRLIFFNSVGNQCVNSFWTIGGVHDVELVRNGLQDCFDNYDQLP